MYDVILIPAILRAPPVRLSASRQASNRYSLNDVFYHPRRRRLMNHPFASSSISLLGFPPIFSLLSSLEKTENFPSRRSRWTPLTLTVFFPPGQARRLLRNGALRGRKDRSPSRVAKASLPALHRKRRMRLVTEFGSGAV